MTAAGFRCHECSDDTRYERGCTRGYREGMDHDQRPPRAVSCAVLLDEPPGFWTSRQLGVWMQRGNPVISADDVSAGDLARAELVCFELDEGERYHREHVQKVHESATKAASGIMPPLVAGARPPWA